MQNLKEYAEKSNTLIAAHRGASGEFPENTIIAIENAVKQGADIIEIDIQLTADNEIVAFHDDFLGRTAPGNKKISELKYNDLRNIDAGSFYSKDFSDQRIPHLNDVIDIIENRAYLMLELKSYKDSNYYDKFKFIYDVINARNFQNKTLFASFDYELLGKIKFQDSKINTSAIKLPDRFINPLELYKKINYDVFICSVDEYDDNTDKIITENNIFSGVYGVDSIDKLNKIRKYNIKAIGTNYPALIKNELMKN